MAKYRSTEEIRAMFTDAEMDEAINEVTSYNRVVTLVETHIDDWSPDALSAFAEFAAQVKLLFPGDVIKVTMGNITRDKNRDELERGVIDNRMYKVYTEDIKAEKAAE
jgi:hypothetical protein